MRFPRAGFAVALALLLVPLALSACRTSHSEDTTPAREDSQEPSVAAADALLQETIDRRNLEEQKKVFLIESYLQSAIDFRDRGDLDRAWESVLRALEVDATYPDAVALYNEIGQLLGYAPQKTQDVKKILAERYEVAKQAQLAEARRRYDTGVDLLDQGRFDQAAYEFEGVISILQWNPYAAESFDAFKADAEARLQEAQSRARTAKKEQDQKLARQAFETLKEEEARIQREKAERVKMLLDEGMERYVAGDYEEAEQLARKVLEIEPHHSAASDLLVSSEEAQHADADRRIVQMRQERYLEWMEGIREAKIPQEMILKWPSRARWDELTRLRMGAEVGEDLDFDSVAIQRIKNQLKTRRVSLDFEDAPLDAVIDYIASVTGINIAIDPEVKTEIDASGTPVRLTNISDIPAQDALEILLALGDGLTYTFNNDVLLVTKVAKAFGVPVPRIHDVRDIAFGLTQFKGPEIRLTTGQDEPEEPIPLWGQSETKEPEIKVDDIVELVRTNIAPDTWDNSPGSIDITNGQLLVVHTLEVQRQVAKFLNDLRKFHGISVSVEARFVTLSDNFLEDFGIDFRGLGGEVGTLADLDDVTNGLEDNTSAGFDNGGVGLPANAARSPSSGFFFDDGGDGDVRARTENIFDNTLGTVLSSTGGLSLELAFLDDIQLNMVLRAVQKSSKATLLNTPVITAYDTQRSSIHLLNQVSYIQDYEVEVAQTAFIADPVVGIIQDGIVFDVRPTVSSDRKYVTLEMHPTVASLRTPIPTFTTGLGGLSFPVTIEIPELAVSRAQTTVTVPDGGTVVIGGLKKIQFIDRKSEIPILSEIPFVQTIFSRKGKSEEMQDLVVIVTAKINDLIEQEQNLGKFSRSR